MAASLDLPSSVACTDAVLDARAAGPLPRLVSGFERGIRPDYVADKATELVDLTPPAPATVPLIPADQMYRRATTLRPRFTSSSNLISFCMRSSALPLARPLDCCLQRSHVSSGFPLRRSACSGAPSSSRQLQCSRLSCRAAAAREHSSTASVSRGAGQGTASEARHDQAGTPNLQQALDCRHFEQCSGCTVAEAAAIAEPPIAARAREYFRGAASKPQVTCTHRSGGYARGCATHSSFT